MPFSAQIYPLLISSPSDVNADADIAIEATLRWNVIYGRQFNSSVMPLHWTRHVAAEYGVRPQESINNQLVEEAEIVIALFWHRLGSDTGKSDSGTIEEIEEAHDRGAHVAVLRCRRDIPSDDLDAEQASKLDSYLLGLRDKALVLDYEDDNGLRQHVETILTRAVSASSAQAKAEATVAAPSSEIQPAAQVWPGLERREAVKTDSKGRVKTENRWFLKLSNTGTEPAKHVKYVLEPDGEGEIPHDLGDDRELESLPPEGESETQLYLHSGVASQVRCTVTWEDSGGEHESVGTLRFF